ncbi:amino acid permease [Nonomuraea sp. NPDC049625]|uniref:amino acid permease n=1 Tax=Nonomuraea sp. NPDC049625 TaxID=3155775 RepID=UPI00342944D5
MTTTDAPAISRLPLTMLTAMVAGSTVGAGVFSLPGNFGQAGVVVAWAVAGTGMLMPAFVFQSLTVGKPDLNAGVYVYAKAGFGEFPGFLSSFGRPVIQQPDQPRSQAMRRPSTEAMSAEAHPAILRQPLPIRSRGHRADRPQARPTSAQADSETGSSSASQGTVSRRR